MHKSTKDKMLLLAAAYDDLVRELNDGDLFGAHMALRKHQSTEGWMKLRSFISTMREQESKAKGVNDVAV
jgi:hypothetical protein